MTVGLGGVVIGAGSPNDRRDGLLRFAERAQIIRDSGTNPRGKERALSALCEETLMTQTRGTCPQLSDNVTKTRGGTMALHGHTKPKSPTPKSKSTSKTTGHRRRR